ncbi:MAG: hypothetical protein V1902_01905 [Candidatus Falkowbacteria bacterium]
MFSKIFSRVLDTYSKPAAIAQGGGGFVKINMVISKPAFWYEKLRSAIDYREDHLLKKAAIFRHLKRLLFWERRHENVAEHLVEEMMRSRYVPNESITKSTVEEIDAIINKYLWLIFKVKEQNFKKLPRKWVDELLEICAVEIEKKLATNLRDEALFRAMFSSMCNRIEMVDSALSEREKEMQIFIASQKALIKADVSTLYFHLFALLYPDWSKSTDMELIEFIAHDYERVIKQFALAIDHPWQARLAKTTRRAATVFTILRDVLNGLSDNKNGGASTVADIVSDPAALAAETKKAIANRYKKIRGRLSRAAVRSIIYVFVTKMTLAFLLELPIDYYFGLGLNYYAIATNILFPPALMFLIALLIKMPPKENIDKIVSESNSIVYQKERKVDIMLQIQKKRPWIVSGIYNLLYVAFFGGVLYLLVRGLLWLHFGPLSIVLCVFFLALVSFFGLRIRRPVRELFVVDKKENVLLLLMDFLFTPFIYMGNWLSIKFSQINIFAIFLDFLIESPFKLLVATTEDLTDFVREKKDTLDRNL